MAELLANTIRNKIEIKGLDINGQPLKISQMADDTVIFVKNVKSVGYVWTHQINLQNSQD